ncbi:MAG: hypothetical protein QM762_07755 [Chryseolinea sp.]
MIEIYGPERLLVNSAGRLGPVETDRGARLHLRRCDAAATRKSLIRKIVYENPLEFQPEPQLQLHPARRGGDAVTQIAAHRSMKALGKLAKGS